MANGKNIHDPMGVCSATEVTLKWELLTTCAGTDKRGVIVYVYPYSNNEQELAALENGDLGFYYN